MDLTIDDILAQLDILDENQRLEAKACHHELGNSVLETISAFANKPKLLGGYPVLGVATKPKTDPQEYYI